MQESGQGITMGLFESGRITCRKSQQSNDSRPSTWRVEGLKEEGLALLPPCVIAAVRQGWDVSRGWGRAQGYDVSCCRSLYGESLHHAYTRRNDAIDKKPAQNNQTKVSVYRAKTLVRLLFNVVCLMLTSSREMLRPVGVAILLTWPACPISTATSRRLLRCESRVVRVLQ